MPLRIDSRGIGNSRPTLQDRGIKPVPSSPPDVIVPNQKKTFGIFETTTGELVFESELRQAIANVAMQEFARWRSGPNSNPRKENEPDAITQISSYWRIALDTRHTDPNTPWSSVFVSFCVQEASRRLNVTPLPLVLSSAHFRYAKAANNKRVSGIGGYYWAYDPNERRLGVGDIIVKERRQNKPPSPPVFYGLTFADLIRRDSADTHGDIVVQISSNEVQVIGGNVKNSVSRTFYPRTPDGRIDTRQSVNDAFRVFAILSLEPPIRETVDTRVAMNHERRASSSV
jgi:hypothetical protein